MNDEPTYEDRTHTELRNLTINPEPELNAYYSLRAVVFALLTIAAAIEKRSV